VIISVPYSFIFGIPVCMIILHYLALSISLWSFIVKLMRELAIYIYPLVVYICNVYIVSCLFVYI
jgi:hypothetical protein